MLTDNGKCPSCSGASASILVALAPEVTLTDRLIDGRQGGRVCGAVDQAVHSFS